MCRDRTRLTETHPVCCSDVAMQRPSKHTLVPILPGHGGRRGGVRECAHRGSGACRRLPVGSTCGPRRCRTASDNGAAGAEPPAVDRLRNQRGGRSRSMAGVSTSTRMLSYRWAWCRPATPGCVPMIGLAVVPHSTPPLRCHAAASNAGSTRTATYRECLSRTRAAAACALQVVSKSIRSGHAPAWPNFVTQRPTTDAPPQSFRERNTAAESVDECERTVEWV